MSIEQWNDREEALKAGDKERAQKILDLGYQPEYKKEMADFSEAELDQGLEIFEEDVMNDVAAGMDNKEIMAKYSISAQKLHAIKKKAE